MICNITTAARSCRKLLLITALTAFLFFNQLLYAGAYLYSQTVTLSVHDMPLEKVCKEIEKQTGYYFVYAKDQEGQKHLISLQVKNELITTVLQKVFSGLPYSYSVIDKVVVINTVKHPAPVTPSATTGATLDTMSVQGRVMNKMGESMVNASITSTKTKKSTITDLKGMFKMKGLDADDMLLVSYAGYKTQLVSPKRQQPVYVFLDVTDNELDKVVVQAYGTTSRRLTTSNIGVVTAKDIEAQRTMNPLLALQGRVAGLEINPASGYELGPVKVEIRGRNVVNPTFTSDPLYIIDGVPLTIMDVAGTNGNPISGNSISYGLDQSKTLFTGGISPLFNVNTADIESIEVLKDADATAIYGSRGANGVILINTKKGKPGKNRVSIGFSQGVSFITRKWEMLNTTQYLNMRREAFKNDGLTPTAAPGAGYAPDLFLADTTRNTDWQEYYWGRKGQWTDAQTDYSGGTGQVNFRIGARYNKSKDITTLGGTSKTSFSVSLNTHSLDNRFNLSFGANYNYTGANLINVSAIATVPPDAPPVYDDQGNLNYIGWKALGLSFPFAGLLQPYSTKVNFLNTNLDLKYSILSGLSARVSLGYNNSDNTSNAYRPLAATDPTATIRIASTSLGINKANNWVVEPQLEYNLNTGVGKWNVLVGGTIQNNATRSMSVIGQGYTNDALLYSISNALTVTSTERYGKYKYAGAFARINYNYGNKYILNLNGRRDGSSRFGAGKQFGNFGSVGAAWILSEETWVRKNVPDVISFIKLRGSYGLTGSDAVGDYQYLSQWGNLSPVLTAYNGVAPLTPQIQSNNDFHWQSNKKAEAALDLGFVNDRYGLSVAYYNNRCNNQLILFPTPVFTGFPNVTANSPANVQNSGWEFQLNASLITKKDFNWNATFNISFNKNKLLSYPLFEQSPFYSKYKIGESLNNRYVLNYLGIDPQTGSYMFEDHNHDGKIMSDSRVQPGTYDDDFYVAINLSPVYMGGMGHNFRYKNWGLTTYFTYKKGMGLNSLRGITSTNANTSLWEYNHRWQNPGDISEAPKVTSVGSVTNFSSSNGGWTDASFIRLQTVGLSYSLPDKIARKAKLSNMAVSINAQHLFVITKYKGGDPEGTNFGSMPPARTITAGITCSL